MIYSRQTYDIKELIVCNLKSLGTKLGIEQQDIKFILWRHDMDLGYNCDGRYTTFFKEALTGFGIDRVTSPVKIPDETNEVYNVETIDMNLFTDEEKEEGRISDIRLLQIYNIINFKRSNLTNNEGHSLKRRKKEFNCRI